MPCESAKFSGLGLEAGDLGGVCGSAREHRLLVINHILPIIDGGRRWSRNRPAPNSRNRRHLSPLKSRRYRYILRSTKAAKAAPKSYRKSLGNRRQSGINLFDRVVVAPTR